MPTYHDASYRLPFLRELSTRDRESLDHAARQLEERQHRADASRQEEVDGLREDLRRDLHDLLGADGLTELQDAIQRERLRFRALWQPPDGLGRDAAKGKQAANARLNALVRKLGADSGRLRRLLGEYDARLLDVVSDADGGATPGYHIEGNLENWLDLSPFHKHPLPWGVVPPIDDPSDPHQWFLFKAPFFGFLFDFWHQAEKFQVDRELVLDPTRAHVGNVVSLDCDDPGFGATAQARADAQIAFPFVPPVTGMLHVVVDVQSVRGIYDLNIRDNFWLSSATAAQYNYIMVSLLYPAAPETQVRLMDESHANSDGDNLSIQNNHLNVVAHYGAEFFSSGPVAAGETLIVTVGTRSVDIAGATRMDLHSRSDFQWFISSVEVRVVP